MPLGEMEELMDNMAGLLKVKRDELSESEEKFQREIDAKVKGINDLIAAKAEKDEQLKSKRLEKAESKREISRLKRILDGRDATTISVYVFSFFLNKTQHRSREHLMDPRWLHCNSEQNGSTQNLIGHCLYLT